MSEYMDKEAIAEFLRELAEQANNELEEEQSYFSTLQEYCQTNFVKDFYKIEKVHSNYISKIVNMFRCFLTETHHTIDDWHKLWRCLSAHHYLYNDKAYKIFEKSLDTKHIEHMSSDLYVEHPTELDL